jgi:hypothetical protein
MTTHRTGSGYHDVEKQGFHLLPVHKPLKPLSPDRSVLAKERAFINDWEERMEVSKIRRNASIQVFLAREVENTPASQV